MARTYATGPFNSGNLSLFESDAGATRAGLKFRTPQA
jgi:hypothetical protein